MAILKELDQEFGLKATYWSADVVNIYWDAGANCIAHIELHGYRSETAKKTGLERSLRNYSYDFNSSNWIFTKGGNNEAEFYTWFLNKVSEEMEKPEDERDEKYGIFDGATSDIE